MVAKGVGLSLVAGTVRARAPRLLCLVCDGCPAFSHTGTTRPATRTIAAITIHPARHQWTTVLASTSKLCQRATPIPAKATKYRTARSLLKRRVIRVFLLRERIGHEGKILTRRACHCRDFPCIDTLLGEPFPPHFTVSPGKVGTSLNIVQVCSPSVRVSLH